MFRREYARITTRGFPHSEIRGSKVVQHLPAAYRSHPRPSSASDAKASTTCPSYLDSLIEHTLCRYAVFKVRPSPGPYRVGVRTEVSRTPELALPPRSRSLKTDQHAVGAVSRRGHEPADALNACGSSAPGASNRPGCRRSSRARTPGVPRGDRGSSTATTHPRMCRPEPLRCIRTAP